MGNPPEIFLPLKSSRLVMLGFGAQGQAEAENLRRSGIEFQLGLRRSGPSFSRAEDAGFRVRELSLALKEADSVVMNLPDHIQAEVFRMYILPHLGSLKRLVFAHGFNTHFGLIPVKGPKHFLVAPKGAASGLREFYGTPNALPAILSVRSENGSKPTSEDQAWAEAYAQAIGCHSRGLFWADFKDETECDLFSEQALLCGGVSELLRKAYEVMCEAGYHPETAYFESLYELKLIVDLIWREGITGMRERISPTARYGDITRGARVIDASVKERMKEVLKEIQSGQFAEEFLAQHDSKNFKNKEQAQSEHPLEKIGKSVRKKLLSDINPDVRVKR